MPVWLLKIGDVLASLITLAGIIKDVVKVFKPTNVDKLKVVKDAKRELKGANNENERAVATRKVAKGVFNLLNP